jgi:hypothetical protein
MNRSRIVRKSDSRGLTLPKRYAYLETVGFKLAHLWGFLWGNAFFQEVVPGYTPDTALTARYAQMVSMDIVFPIRVLT